MVKKNYLNTSYITQCFVAKTSIVYIEQKTSVSNKIITIKQSLSYKKTKSHSEISKLIHRFALQKRSNTFANKSVYRREKYISASDGQYQIVKSFIM